MHDFFSYIKLLLDHNKYIKIIILFKHISQPCQILHCEKLFIENELGFFSDLTESTENNEKKQI